MTAELLDQVICNAQPYPADMDVGTLDIRRIRRADRLLEENYFDDMSFDHRRKRFLGGIAKLSSEELDQLCDVDYHDSMAFIATATVADKFRVIAVARYAQNPTQKNHELAISTADGFELTKLPYLLLERLISHARKNGIKRLYSIEFRDNMEVQMWANAFNMECRQDPDDIHQVIYSLDL